MLFSSPYSQGVVYCFTQASAWLIICWMLKEFTEQRSKGTYSSCHMRNNWSKLILSLGRKGSLGKMRTLFKPAQQKWFIMVATKGRSCHWLPGRVIDNKVIDFHLTIRNNFVTTRNILQWPEGLRRGWIVWVPAGRSIVQKITKTMNTLERMWDQITFMGPWDYVTLWSWGLC